MKRVHAFLPATALFLVLAGCGGGTATTSSTDGPAVPADGVEFKITAGEGDSVTYQAKMTMDGEGPAQPGVPSEINVVADMKQTVKVTKVEDGKITMETSFSDVKVTGTEMIANILKQSFGEQKSTITVDEKGRVLNSEGMLDANSMAGGTVFFPDGKVKVGDEWEQKLPSEGTSMTASYKFEGMETVDGVDAAKIVMTPKGDNTSSGSFTYWIDTKTGMAIKGNGKITNEANGSKMVISMDVKRV
jgi:hypothetical protein